MSDNTNSEQTEDDILAATVGDVGGLRSDDLYLAISRFQADDGTYWTDININRPVRRLYAVGLLQEAITLLSASGAEYISPGDDPLVVDNIGGNGNDGAAPSS